MVGLMNQAPTIHFYIHKCGFDESSPYNSFLYP